MTAPAPAIPTATPKLPRISEVVRHPRYVTLKWSDGKAANYHHLWLRDNCPSGFHPDTEERLFRLTSVSEDIHPLSVEYDEEHLTIAWSEGDHQSRYRLQWLYDNAYSRDFGRDTEEWAEPWGKEMADKLYDVDYAALMNDDHVLFDWLKAVKRWGISYVRNVPCTDQGVIDVAERIAFLRQTNFGTTFNVRAEPNPINNAYTAEALPLHIDLINQEVPPGFQFLHCLINEAEGGESTYADGFNIIEELKCSEPEAFKLLKGVAIPLRFHDSQTDIRSRKPVIGVDDADRLVELRFNAHLADTFDLDEAVMDDYYRAYRKLMALVHDERFVISVKMKPGDLCIFDNRRVLHGRAAFDAGGKRHLRGCYVDRGDFDSRLRVLSRRYGEAVAGL